MSGLSWRAVHTRTHSVDAPLVKLYPSVRRDPVVRLVPAATQRRREARTQRAEVEAAGEGPPPTQHGGGHEQRGKNEPDGKLRAVPLCSPAGPYPAGRGQCRSRRGGAEAEQGERAGRN